MSYLQLFYYYCCCLNCPYPTFLLLLLFVVVVLGFHLFSAYNAHVHVVVVWIIRVRRFEQLLFEYSVFSSALLFSVFFVAVWFVHSHIFALSRLLFAIMSRLCCCFSLGAVLRSVLCCCLYFSSPVSLLLLLLLRGLSVLFLFHVSHLVHVFLTKQNAWKLLMMLICYCFLSAQCDRCA